MIDLDETLIHYDEEQSTLSLRPGAESFLKLMSNFYEIIIFTAATHDYAEWALSYFQTEARDCISHILSRTHVKQLDGHGVKDLSLIGRNLAKTIILDNLAENFCLQPTNGIHVQTWISDPHDKEFFELAPFLVRLVEL